MIGFAQQPLDEVSEPREHLRCAVERQRLDLVSQSTQPPRDGDTRGLQAATNLFRTTKSITEVSAWTQCSFNSR